MGVTSCLISNVSYLVKGDQPFRADDLIEVPGQLNVTIEDPNGTYNFTRGQPIQLIDSVSGVLYSGTVVSSQPILLGLASTYIEHTLTCTDKTYPFTKLPNTTNYENWYAGDVATDMVVNGSLAGEGVIVAANLRHDTTNVDFNSGILNGTVGTLNDEDDGDLELAPAGSDVLFSERTTADFATGTLTNCTAVNNTLTPNTQKALKFSVILPISDPANSVIRAKIWAASSITLGASDTLNFDVWIADSSPDKMGTVYLLFSDLSRGIGVYDQNGLLVDADTDLSGYAVNQWYTRQIPLSSFSGKTIIAVLASVGGSGIGTYTWYVRNCYLSSRPGSKFFAPTDTVLPLNPPIIYQSTDYLPSTFTATVATTFDPNNSYRVSPTHSISGVGLIKSTNILWEASSTTLLYVSYNGGSSWIACTNNAPLPGLPAGSNVAGLSMQLKESLTAGNDPTAIPILDSVAVNVLSAPNATKSDVVTSFITQANWNSGTHSATQADVSGNLKIASFTRDWASGGTTGQTPFLPTGTSESVAGGAYTMTCGDNDSTGANGFGTSRFDSLGSALDFTIECDLKSSSNAQQTGITYRQIYWNAAVNNTFGYLVFILPGSPGYIELGYGSNSQSDGYTAIQDARPNISTNTFYHVKIVVNGTHHQVYFNNATTPILDAVDNRFTQAGGFGLRGYHNVGDTGAKTSTWDNLVLAQQQTGTWTSPSTSVSSLATCGGSVITWQQTGADNPARAYAFVQSSIDGGSTYQQCISGQPLPGLTSGVSLASKSVKIQVLLGTQTNAVPMVSGLVWRVLGQYPGSTGTRSTAPMGIDYIVRANQAGWGTASDSQAWAKTGTGTDAVSGNTLTIASTTGDVHERLGSRTWADQDGTVRFKLSSSADVGGMELRYVDANNYYRLSVSTTNISITKKVAGITTVLALASTAFTTNTLYRMRFRIIGSNPVALYGNVWPDGVLEPTIDSTTYQWNDGNWTLMAAD
jgi:hypothetical protein